MQLPNEIINYIYEYHNPHKINYTNSIVKYFKTKQNHKKLLNEFKRYVLHDTNGCVIMFATDALLIEIM